MCSYNAETYGYGTNGNGTQGGAIPSCANKYIMNDLARDEWGFVRAASSAGCSLPVKQLTFLTRACAWVVSGWLHHIGLQRRERRVRRRR